MAAGRVEQTWPSGGASGAEPDAAPAPELQIEASSSFGFIPRDLTVKAGKLIESFHAIHGCGCLSDMLWHSDARSLVEAHADLAKIFKSASKSRCAQRTDNSLMQVATIVFSLEMLARDFAGWGLRFPAAKQKAERLLVRPTQRARIWLMDLYLYSRAGMQRGLADAVAPASEHGNHQMTRKITTNGIAARPR